VSREYTIAGGAADARRLARQAHVMAGATSAFLAQIGVASGWACLDVGCGQGQVTIELAGIVGPSGRVVGIDVDPGALDGAREAAARAGVAVEFVSADAARDAVRKRSRGRPRDVGQQSDADRR
jgi:2-polyprenyl-3-methyl-5-hydroxy-6-metoxy-1,4-benzoquinol methylase